MQNFVFHNPTKIIFGSDTIPLIGNEASQFGKKVLLVYGQQSIKKNGIYDTVVGSLDKAGLTVIEHRGVRSNPTLNHVRDGITLAKNYDVEVIVAVGGGSVIDSAKTIAAGALVEHDVWLFFKGKKSIKKTLPILCILTLAAAGSEMNSGMVLTNEETQQKFGIGNKALHPKVSILDPSTTFTVPATYTAYGAVDAIAHILEFYFTTKEPHTPVQDRFMEGLALSLLESCDQCLANPTDYEARSNLMWCSTLALNGLTAAGLGKVGFPMHAIEHSLSALYDVPHGAGLSVVMPGWMQYEAEKEPSKFSQFAERIFNLVQGTPQEKALHGIKQLKQWFEKINCPTNLSGIGIPEADILKIAQNSLAQAKLWRLHDLTQKKVETILKLCV